MTTAIAPTVTNAATTAAPAADRVSERALRARFEDLSLYAEGGNATLSGEVWYVPESAPFFGEDGLTFSDLLDLINPLHHIPVVSTLYRHFSGDTIAPGPRLFGGALFGGPFGFVNALVNAVVEDSTGADIGGNVMAMITSESKTAPAGPVLADAAAGPETDAARSAALATRSAPPLGKGTPAEAETQAAADALLRARSAVPRAGAGRIALPGAGLPPARSAAEAGGGDRPGIAESAAAEFSAPGAVALYAGPPDAPGAGNPETDAPLGVPHMMMQALDKYEAMVRERRGQKVAEEI